ncbi:hypothetical protein SprV_0200683000 [Sparganum proliferum]
MILCITSATQVHLRLLHLDDRRLSAFKPRRQSLSTRCNWALSDRPKALGVDSATSGDCRPCGDYRALINATILDRHPVPHLHDFAGALSGKTVFLKTDSMRVFYQTPVTPDNMLKTAVTAPFGLFEFIRMPLGLQNTTQLFQGFTEHVSCGLPFAYAYIDDLLMAGQDAEEHKVHLALALDILD